MTPVELLFDSVTDLAKDLKESATAKKQRASGDWIDSVEVVQNVDTVDLMAEDYTRYLTRGRGPNKNSSQREIMAWAVGVGSPGGYIYEWVQVKGLPHNPIAVAYNIAKNGTVAFPDGSDLIDGILTDKRLDDMMRSVGENIALSMSEDILRTLKKEFA